MASSASPIDIAPPARFGSNSPRNQTSNLTSALQEAGATAVQPADFSFNSYLRPDDSRPGLGGRQDSNTNLNAFGSSFMSTGARPISFKDRARRESNNAGSFMGGMSWGHMSVGSWVRDDIIMAGTSPSAFQQSPSFHSSSYLPKMEANFLRDYNCCGQRLESLHELLQHFEENHAQQSNQILHRPSVSGQSGRRPSQGQVTSAFSGVEQSRSAQTPRSSATQSRTVDSFSRTQLSTVQDMDSLEDMEMDDAVAPTSMAQQAQQGYGTTGIAPLNTNMANTMTAQQAFRTSTPTTPSASQAFSLFGNPTVSSVNTPALTVQSTQQLASRTSPQTSMPGTPGELDPNFSALNIMSGLGGMGTNSQMLDGDFNFANLQFGLSNNFNDMTIDEPAKRLFSKQGGMNNRQLQAALKSGQIPMNGDLGQGLQGQQGLGGLGPMPIFPEQENKPFKCPVIGCEKAYKNQNGLKYHKAHGHQNQKLKENEDGSFSIVDPETSIPYPGTVGMEREKPYRCEVCGKRYKNLNGLKYHRAHSPPCNPELKMNTLGGLGGQGLQGLQGLNPNANIAGAGLVGMADTNIFP